MGIVNDNFSQALRALLNGQFTPVLAERGCSPSRARQAKVDEGTISQATAQALELPFEREIGHLVPSYEFVMSVPIGFARRHGLMGFASQDGSITLAMSDLAQWPQVQVLQKTLRRPLKAVFAPVEEIRKAVNLSYQLQSGRAQRVIEELNRDQVLQDIQKLSKNEDLLDVDSREPVIRLVNSILFDAVKSRASDVHVEPHEDNFIVRQRVDGVLRIVLSHSKAIQDEVISRIKVMGAMNVAERRSAQDGRATVEVGDREIDLRIATLPTEFGERAVIRLLDKSARLYQLGELGMPGHILETFRGLIAQDHGIILVTGPTGSGKTTTLYAAIQELDCHELNILTLEDPIEYRLEGIGQTQVSEKKGMTFAGGLRHVLRQDPDVIMVGEIRDAETAHMAIQSALTGHLVFSTLHTNDAASAVARMLDLGVEPYLLASCLLGTLAQRLVRRICPKCKAPYEPVEADFVRWGLADIRTRAGGLQLHQGRGCEDCLATGYRERLGIFELLEVSEEIQELILKRSRSSSIKSAAITGGMTTLRMDGVAKAMAGVTTMDEVVYVAGRDEF